MIPSTIAPYEETDLAPSQGERAARQLRGFEAWLWSVRRSFAGRDYDGAFEDPLDQRWPFSDRPVEAGGQRDVP